MNFLPTIFEGAWLIRLDMRKDERGFFARTMCQREFAAQGLASEFVQTNASGNIAAGTLRGLHFQRAPHAEVKLVRCTRGAIFDVIVDLRPQSSTFLMWQGFRLSASGDLLLYVPAGFAHGYQTLEPATEVTYQVSAFYAPQAEGGLRYDDPAIGIEWPLPISSISPKDASWPLLEREAAVRGVALSDAGASRLVSAS
jgi:dTDP-4-dehydrorhamnose 3,5-epimerase